MRPRLLLGMALGVLTVVAGVPGQKGRAIHGVR
jgi:hypothetical protein